MNYSYNELLFNYKLMNIWVDMKQRGKSLKPYFDSNSYSRVAIYGMTELGDRLFYELKDIGIDVAYVIDENPYVLGDFKLIKPDDDLPEADVIIVSNEMKFDRINNNLSKKTSIPVVGLADVFRKAYRMIV